jgi:hypothetical protein
MLSLRTCSLFLFLLLDGAAFSQKPRMAQVVPDSIKKNCEKFMLQYISKQRYDSCVSYDAKESWGAGYRSQGKKDTSWSYEVRYKFKITGREKAEYSFYFSIIDGKITNIQSPFPDCIKQRGALNIIAFDKAKEILFKNDPDFKTKWEKVHYTLAAGECFLWSFNYSDEAPKNGAIPSSSLLHSISINANTGEVITPKSGNR